MKRAWYACGQVTSYGKTPTIFLARGFPGGAVGKESACSVQETQEMWVWSLCQEDPLEKGMAMHSSIIAWRIPWTEETGGLQSMGSQRVGHGWVTNTSTSQVAQLVKNLPAQCRRRKRCGFNPWGCRVRHEWVCMHAFWPTQYLVYSVEQDLAESPVPL